MRFRTNVPRKRSIPTAKIVRAALKFRVAETLARDELLDLRVLKKRQV